jgi:hypothetical protein
MHRLLFPLLLLPIVGCVAGFDRSILASRLAENSLQVTDKSIEEVMALQPQLHFPCNIAVYLHPSEGCEAGRWTARDKLILESWGKTLQQEGIAANLFPISDMFVDKKDIGSLRLAAARYGADVLLIIKGASQTNSYLNPAAVFNLTIVGGFIVPASHRDSLYVIQGALVDVNNGYVYASAESEGQGSIIRPTFIIDDAVAVDRAKKQALENFGPEFLRRLRHLQTLYPPPAPQAASLGMPGHVRKEP